MHADGPLRITQIMLSKGFGGGERYFVDLALALADAGHLVQVLCHARYPGLDELHARADVTVATTTLRGMWDALSARRFTAQVAAFGPDVMHGHMARGAWAGGKVVGRHGGRLVATTHNYVDLKYYRQVHSFIPTTRDQAAYLEANGVPGDRIERIPNLSALSPAAEVAHRPSRGITFVSVGRFVPKKGFDVLLEALARVRARGVEARLLLGGDGPENRRLRRLAENLDLGPYVNFTGWIGDVGPFLARGDAFVLPSLDEPFGIVMLEAMAAGRPIVTSRSQGPSEVLDERTAWFAELGDPETLAEGMAALAGHPTAARAKARRALERYRELYWSPAVVPQIVALYGAAISGDPTPALRR
jgi:glycosyltransferase involved in cell wall biosynthesis